MSAIISGDPSRLQQVIWNLVNNASKFTPKGGHIEVKMERVDSQVEVSVSDTGEGIAPELLPHIFERFQQGDVSTKRKRAVSASVWRSSNTWSRCMVAPLAQRATRQGKGAKFTVLLPIDGFAG